MVRTLPLGVISLDTAVELIARHTRHGYLYPTIVYRNEADAAWRKLCALSEDHVRPLMLTSDGVIQKVDRTQIFGFADKYWKFASVLRYPPNGEGVQQEVNEHCPSHDLLDESGRLHRGARLVFLESEIEMAFDAAADPGAIDVARKRPPTEEPDRKPAGDEASDDADGGVEIERFPSYALLDKPRSGGELVFIESGIGTAPETSAPKPRARPQRDKAKRLLQNMFPNGMPPKDKLPPCALLAKCKGPEWDGLKRDSILRAAKELREAAARK